MSFEIPQSHEYGIQHAYLEPSDAPVHRDGFTKEEAEKWIEGWLEDGGFEGMWYIIVRPLGTWRRA